MSAAALITALTKKAKAAVPPSDEEISQALATILSQQVTILGQQVTMLNRLKSLEGAMEEAGIEQIPFAFNLLPLQGVRLTEELPFKQYTRGYVKEVTIHWPAGCNALVDVRVGYAAQQFCPEMGFLALNDATPTYPFNLPVELGNQVWVEMRNTDAANPHNITVTVTVMEKAT